MDLIRLVVGTTGRQPMIPDSVLRLQTGEPTDTIARRIHVKRVGRDDGARCFCFFLVVLACKSDTSHFSYFPSLSPCKAIFRFLIRELFSIKQNV